MAPPADTHTADAHDCAFCKIAATYPHDRAHPIPVTPKAAAISPQCHLVLSTPTVLAFLDIMPMSPGHILLTTRGHHEKLTDIHTTTSTSTGFSLHTSEAAQLGIWLPRLSRALCRVTGVEDWNIVQNNGARAAQVVPHVHFHLIPRYQEGKEPGREAAGKKGVGSGTAPVAGGLARSWTMFGRGTRTDLDDEEGAGMAARFREALRSVMIEEEGGQRKKKSIFKSRL